MKKRSDRNNVEVFKSRINYTPTCWNWTGGTHVNGYGRYKEDGILHTVHRYAYRLWKGPLIPGKVVMHECDNKLCVNPEHLEQGTASKNTKDAFVRGLNYKKGESNQRAKLNEEQVRKVRALAELGLSHTEIAKLFNVTRRTIYNIVHRICWTHI